MQEQKAGQRLEQKQLKLLRAKLEFMQYWTTLFFHEQHRAVMAYLCAKKLEGVQKVTSLSDGAFWRSKNMDNLVTELKNGFLVNFETAKIDKEEVRFAWVNLDFFGTYSTLLQEIRQTIKPELEEIRKFSQSEIRKKCQNCGTIRAESELKHLQDRACECANSNFVVMQLKKSKKDRIQKIDHMLKDKMYKMNARIAELTKEVEDSRRKKSQQNSKKPNPFDEYCLSFGAGKISEEQLVRSNNYQRKKALDMYGRKTRINFKEQLLQIRKMRQNRINEEMNMML